MSTRPSFHLGLLAVPLIYWVRYLLIVPALVVWGFLLVFAGDFAGGGLGQVIELVVFVPLFGWYFVEALLDPTLTPSFTDDAWMEPLQQDLAGFLIRLAVVASFILWALAAIWRKIRGEREPIQRTARQRLGRSTLWAAGIAAFYFLTSAAFPHYSTRSIGVGGHLFVATAILVALLFTGWWVTLVGVSTDRLLDRVDPPPEL